MRWLRRSGRRQAEARPGRKLVKDARGQTLSVPGASRNAARWAGTSRNTGGRSLDQHDQLTRSRHPRPVRRLPRGGREAGAAGDGSELVGLIPLQALLDAGDHYLARQGRPPESPRRSGSTWRSSPWAWGDRPLRSGQKVIEYRYRGAAGGLRSMRLTEFSDELSSDSPLRRGSVAALCGSLSSALSSMVAALTWSKRAWRRRVPR